MKYELLFLVGHDKEADLETIEKSIEGFVGEIGGTFSEGRWESKRHLAYPIKHQDRGVYVARRFTLPKRDLWAKDAEDQGGDPLVALSKSLRLFHDVLRFSIVRAEDLEDLEVFASRKDEERKTHRQDVEKKERDARAKQRPGTSRSPIHRSSPASVPTSAPKAESVSQEAPKKEISVTEINDKLDEILNA